MDVRYDGNYVDLEERIQDLEMELDVNKKILKAAERQLWMLQALENSGVDNWEGWDHAIDQLSKEHPEYWDDCEF